MTGIAYSLLPNRFEDKRHEAIEAGLRAVGYRVEHGPATEPRAVAHDDVVVTWNAYGRSGQIADAIKAGGGTAIVCEEGYIRRVNGEKYFAIGLNGHNGSGAWEIGDDQRWPSWGIPIKPWRGDGDEILVCGQRGFGYNAMAMPDDWPDRVFAELRAVTKRPLWFRAHPKRRRRMPTSRYDKVLDFDQPFEDHLRGAWATVVWSSACAVHSLLAGVPVAYRAPHTVVAMACTRNLAAIDRLPSFDLRSKAMHRMAWAQWSLAEIARGDPFRHNRLDKKNARR